MQCGGPDMMRKTCHRLVFHLAIIHENEYLVVIILLCPLHLRMRCSESAGFCNKRGFMWVFVRAVSYRAKGCSPGVARGRRFRLPPPTFTAFRLMVWTRLHLRPVWGGPGMWLAISAAFTGAALPAFPDSSARIA